MKTILFIEDDKVLRENTAEILELANYSVMTAFNGKDGVALGRKKQPDLIICDIMMPELDGYGVLNTLSKYDKTKYIPFIFLSAKTEHKDIRKGMNLGADDYITKPYEEEELICAIESRLAKAAILKDLRHLDQSKTKEREASELKSINDFKNFIYDNGQALDFDKNATIYEEGHNANFLYLVIDGIVKCSKIDEQGKELATALCKADDLFGYAALTQQDPYPETAVAIENTKLAGISRNSLHELLNQNHEISLELIQLLNKDLSMIKERLLKMAYSTVNKKTAATILKFAEKINRKPDDVIKISRYDLASVAGIATETLIRSIAELKNEGVVKSEGRNIKVTNLEKLRQLQ